MYKRIVLILIPFFLSLSAYSAFGEAQDSSRKFSLVLSVGGNLQLIGAKDQLKDIHYDPWINTYSALFQVKNKFMVQASYSQFFLFFLDVNTVGDISVWYNQSYNMKAMFDLSHRQKIRLAPYAIINFRKIHTSNLASTEDNGLESEQYHYQDYQGLGTGLGFYFDYTFKDYIVLSSYVEANRYFPKDEDLRLSGFPEFDNQFELNKYVYGFYLSLGLDVYAIGKKIKEYKNGL